MASNTYTQTYADNTSRSVRRAKKQGAPRKPDELKHTETVVFHLTPDAKNKFISFQKSYSMSQSAFGDLVIFYGLERITELSGSNNC